MTKSPRHSPLATRRWLLIAGGHAAVFVLVYWIAFLLRFGFQIPENFQSVFLKSLPCVLAIKLGVFWGLQNFSSWWRHVSFQDLIALGKALALTLAVIVIADYLVFPFWIPRGIPFIDALLTGVVLGLARSSWRLADEGFRWPNEIRKPVLMVSNHQDSAIIASRINSARNGSHRVVGLLTDAPNLLGTSRAGVPVIGDLDNTSQLAADYDAKEIWLVAGELDGRRLRELRNQLDASGQPIKIVPNSIDAISANGSIPIRDIDIKDLLQRDEVQLDTELLSEQIRGTRVMVTGAGGSIGSEICRQLLRFEPAEIVLLDHRENSVFLIHQELEEAARSEQRVARDDINSEQTNEPILASRHSQLATLLHPCVGDILDEPRMRALFEKHRPQYVYHAAAHKHVGLMELNPGEAVKNNVFGTKAVADLSAEFEAKKFVLISTDKAVNPTSVMGATKQLAERYVIALSHSDSYQHEAQASGSPENTERNGTSHRQENASYKHDARASESVNTERNGASHRSELSSSAVPAETNGNPTRERGAGTDHLAACNSPLVTPSSLTKFVVVRFGNVLGSNGSVVPIFKQQIANGGPITITDERMTRYFMTIPEASQLVLQAGAMGKGGEIFVLEMGEQIKIIDLARELIRLSGLPEEAIEIKTIGMRPGEKLFEELRADYECAKDTQHSKVKVLAPVTQPVEKEVLQELRSVANEDGVRELVGSLCASSYQSFVSSAD